MRQRKFSFICSLILFVLACSSMPPATVNEGAKLFRDEQYREAIGVFERVLEKDPENVKATYNIALSYYMLQDEENALMYLNKTIKLDSSYSMAWYNIAAIQYRLENYKEAIKAAVKVGGKAKEIKNKSIEKLKERDIFISKHPIHIRKDVNLPSIDVNRTKNLFYLLSLSENGKVEETFCGKEGDEEVCDFYRPFLFNLEFIPAYDLEKMEPIKSKEIGFIKFYENGEVSYKVGLEIGKKTDNNLQKTKPIEKKEPLVLLGAIDRKDIDSVIRERISDIRNCYEPELLKDRKLKGRIVVHFIIDEDGDVPVAKINRSTMKNENVEECVVETIKGLKFPIPRGRGFVVVNYPFLFSAKN